MDAHKCPHALIDPDNVQHIYEDIVGMRDAGALVRFENNQVITYEPHRFEGPIVQCEACSGMLRALVDAVFPPN